MKKLFIVLLIAVSLVTCKKQDDSGGNAGTDLQQTIAANNMTRISGGIFTMGSPADETGRLYSEGPQHQVTISPFFLGKYEVTQKEWHNTMETTVQQQREKKINPFQSAVVGIGDIYPMYHVSWFEAIDFCNRLSRKENLTPAYTIAGRNVLWDNDADGYRLPTEAEWEYACRAGTTTTFYTGSAISDDSGWYDMNSGRSPHPVGSKPANAWGLYDMHGNVSEWCWDRYSTSYSKNDAINPTGVTWGWNRVIRGGNWSSSSQSVRSADRGFYNPTDRDNGIGFRLARNAQ
ncbi:MAG: formylglycine-generating enzyme family protein [Treponema sp.]|jgi:formylglycine-generating enzyme required for sulfatase activity|nr:formylglycine-generating enzyme family protein [Treponema sp.]